MGIPHWGRWLPALPTRAHVYDMLLLGLFRGVWGPRTDTVDKGWSSDYVEHNSLIARPSNWLLSVKLLLVKECGTDDCCCSWAAPSQPSLCRSLRHGAAHSYTPSLVFSIMRACSHSYHHYVHVRACVYVYVCVRLRACVHEFRSIHQQRRRAFPLCLRRRCWQSKRWVLGPQRGERGNGKR